MSGMPKRTHAGRMRATLRTHCRRNPIVRREQTVV
jgi:hypothetical protein